MTFFIHILASYTLTRIEWNQHSTQAWYTGIVCGGVIKTF
jgi:hypothetical protein